LLAKRALMISSADARFAETQCAFIDSCRAAGVRHVVKFSGAESSIGYDPRKFRFTRMHEDVERYLEGSGLAWTDLRPSQFMQVCLREAPTIAAKGAIFLPFRDIRLSPIDIEDIAKIAFAVLRDGGHAGKSYDMTGPEALTMTEIAERTAAAIGMLPSRRKSGAGRCWRQALHRISSTPWTKRPPSVSGIPISVPTKRSASNPRRSPSSRAGMPACSAASPGPREARRSCVGALAAAAQ
jgi:nucleoside-diphosphate-sugar epimerase